MNIEKAVKILRRHLLSSAKTFLHAEGELIENFYSADKSVVRTNQDAYRDWELYDIENGELLLKPVAEGGGGFFPEEQEALNYLLKEASDE